MKVRELEPTLERGPGILCGGEGWVGPEKQSFQDSLPIHSSAYSEKMQIVERETLGRLILIILSRDNLPKINVIKFVPTEQFPLQFRSALHKFKGRE